MAAAQLCVVKPKTAPHIIMKNTHLILLGLTLMLIGLLTPRIVPSLALTLGIIFTLCYVVGLLMLIIGGIRKSREKKKTD